MNIFNVNIEMIANFFFAGLCGLLLKICLSYSDQKWVNTYHYTLTFILLPVITLTITRIISNNIALALGMVGALSIVRFRTPIKNPLELSYYFLLITFGICANVNLNLSFNLLFFITGSFIVFKVGTLVLSKYNLFDMAFNTERRYYLVLALQSKDSSLESYEELINYNHTHNNEYVYHISSNSKEKLLKLIEKYDDSELKNFELRKASNIEGYL